MADTITHLMTVDEFRLLPETGPFYYELRRGELVSVTRPKMKHVKVQRRLRQLLEAMTGNSGIVEIEIAFRAIAEHDLRIADVAFVSQERWQRADPDDNLLGAPELVIEVLSPSNTATEIFDKEKLCLENGCREFWVVDPVRRQVKVSTPDGLTKTYPEGQQIPMGLFHGVALPVATIFSE